MARHPRLVIGKEECCCVVLFIKIWSLDTALPGTASENLHDESAIIITRVAPPSP